MHTNKACCTVPNIEAIRGMFEDRDKAMFFPFASVGCTNCVYACLRIRSKQRFINR